MPITIVHLLLLLLLPSSSAGVNRNRLMVAVHLSLLLRSPLTSARAPKQLETMSESLIIVAGVVVFIVDFKCFDQPVCRYRQAGSIHHHRRPSLLLWPHLLQRAVFDHWTTWQAARVRSCEEPDGHLFGR